MAEAQHIDFSKLLGFDTVSDLMSDGVDFRDDILGAKLGAKVGADGEPSPVRDAELTEKSKAQQ